MWYDNKDHWYYEYNGIKGWDDEEGTLYAITASVSEALHWMELYLRDVCNEESDFPTPADLSLLCLKEDSEGNLVAADGTDLEAAYVYECRSWY